MLWKELLWRLVTGISTSEFLLNLGIFFSALSVGRKWTNYQEPSDLLKRFHHLILLFGDWLCWEVKRESEQICLVAPKTLYIFVPISIPETFGKTELSDIAIVFYPVILMQFYHCQISAGILLAFAGTNSPPVARSLLPRQTVAFCGDVGLYTVSLYDMICVNSVDNRLRVINLFLVSPRPCSSGWNITSAWHVICTGICYCKLTYL